MNRRKRIFGILAGLSILSIMAVAQSTPSQQSAEDLYEAALLKKEAEGDLNGAINLFQNIVTKFPDRRDFAAKAQFQIGICYEKLGLKQAQEAFQKVIEKYPDQGEMVKAAREKLALLASPREAAEKGAREFRMQKVWDAPIYSWFSSPSSDGKYLAYSSEQDFMSLGVYDLVKGESRLLTHNKSWFDAGYCYDPIISPDTSQIAYCCQVKDRIIQLRTVNIDGTSTRILRDGKDGLDYIPFGWTSDGKQILTAFFGRDNISGIAFISPVDGLVKKKLALSFKVSSGTEMSLSPDERFIAGGYLPRKDSTNKDIFLLAIDGGKEVPLVEHPADDQLIGWSPDGKQVLFTSDRTGTIGIWTVRVSGGKAVGTPEFVRGNMGNIQPIGITRSGKLYYKVSSGSSDIFIASVDPATGKVLAPPAKAVRKYETFNSTPDWSPDSQFLVCRSSRGSLGNEAALLILSMQTNEVRELIPKTSGGRLMYYYLRWSPDGRSFLGVGRDDKEVVGALLLVVVLTGEA